MEAQQFAYWLQGFAEVNGKAPTEEQWEVIKEHLDTVFNKVTTKRVGQNMDDVLKRLNEQHQHQTPVLPYDIRFPQTTLIC